jgi:hypothetical protein
MHRRDPVGIVLRASSPRTIVPAITSEVSSLSLVGEMRPDWPDCGAISVEAYFIQNTLAYKIAGLDAWNRMTR